MAILASDREVLPGLGSSMVMLSISDSLILNADIHGVFHNCLRMSCTYYRDRSARPIAGRS